MSLWVVLYAVGAVQAAMLAPALWCRKANAGANRVLALWLAVIGVDLAVRAIHMAAPEAGLGDAFRIARLLPFAYAPMFFVYVRALTTGRETVPGDLVHGAWFLLVLAWAGGRWLQGRPLEPMGSWDAPWFDPLLLLVALAYLGAAALQIRRHRRWLHDRRSDADRLSLRWLSTMTASQFVVWGIAAAHALSPVPFLPYPLIYVAVAAWVCMVGWFSQGQPPVVVAQPGEAPGAGGGAGGEDLAGEDPRFDDVEARLSVLMEGHAMYRESALTIAQLARRSGYPEYLVSAVINRRLGGNFWDYVNRHRVEDVRARLADPGEQRGILELAYEAGFTSKSTFNTAFKRIVGETPSTWRKRRASQVHDRAERSPPA